MDFIQIYSGVVFGLWLVAAFQRSSKSMSHLIASIIIALLPLPIFLRVWGIW